MRSIPAAQTQLKSFGDDTRGVTAILFAMLAAPLLCLIFLAIDYSRADNVRTSVAHAADTAAETGAKMLGLPHDQIEGVVSAYMKSNLPAGSKDLPFSLTFAPDDTALTIKVDTSIPATMLAIGGHKNIAINIERTATRPEPIKELQQPSSHHGITPDDASLPPLNRAPREREMREAEAQIRDMLEQLQRSGAGSPDIDRILRVLENHR
jgi:Putative Flp pilus-assembly TadE/G-like